MAKVTEPHKWDAAEREWMEEYVPGHHRKEIVEEHNRLFPDRSRHNRLPHTSKTIT